jgi:chromosome segregation ATPase
MGALLVVLIAVSRSACAAAVREVAAQKAAAATEGQQDARQKFEQVNQYVARLNSVRAEAEKRRRDDQLRLSHVEDHMRRLKEQLQTLQNSAYELASLEGEHYDDRKQAEREVDRLGQLISASREAIASLRRGTSRCRSHAIIPHDGLHGTRRRRLHRMPQG